ncbi:MAG: hypothetical protein EZS28_001901 [Streblomastix strix]|uniref:Uncharacterized protein n=1 Tax=Streblomastix strix TaxID=222440 RepID=A0A5J4X5T9_9EUKA|nr:MAG: hypothetical protein EZS28_001901 [Streblomastix strix]
MKNRTKTTDQLPRMDFGLGKEANKDDKPQITGTTEASLYLKLMDSTKTNALNNKDWRENMIPPKEIFHELYLWQGVIVKNQEMTLEVRIPEAVMVSDASPKVWGVTRELQTEDTLVQHEEWNMKQKRWKSNKKEMEAIYLGLFRQ